MPQQNPITRLRQIQLGLSRLAREYEATTKEKPANLIWWSEELGEVIDELESTGPTPDPARTSEGAPATPTRSGPRNV